MLLVGSIAFGLEALLLGLGGKLQILYRRRRDFTLASAFLIGLGIAGLALATAAIFGLGPLYLVAFVLAYTVLTGGVIALSKSKFVKSSPPPPSVYVSEEEIEEMLKRRGFDRPAEEE